MFLNLGKYPRPDGLLLFQYENKYHLIVIELKFNKTIREAFKQIVGGQYAERCIAYVKRRSGIAVDERYVYLAAGNMDKHNQVYHY